MSATWLFVVANNLTSDDVLDPGARIWLFPRVWSSSRGGWASCPGGFPPELQARVLKGRPPLTDRPGRQDAPGRLRRRPREGDRVSGRAATNRDALSTCSIRRVFLDLAAHERIYSDTLDPADLDFLRSLTCANEHLVEIEPGKTLIVKLLAVGDAHIDGKRTVFFELNGQPREVEVVDRSLASSVRETPMADPADPSQIAAPLPDWWSACRCGRRRRA